MKDFHEFCITDMIIFMLSRDLRILAILKTLNVLRSLSVCIDLRLASPLSSLYKRNGMYVVILSSNNEKHTTVPSSQFIGSAQYLPIPRAINLRNISVMNV